MVSLIKSILLVLLGATLGILGSLLWVKQQENLRLANTPKAPGVSSAQVQVVPEPTQPPDTTNLFGRATPIAPPATTPSPVAEAPKPPQLVEEEPEPVAQVNEPAPQPANPEPTPVVTVTPEVSPADLPPVDFAELCIKPAAWPLVITLNKAIDAQILQGTEVIGELPLVAGERLQVSKVFGDGTVEVRAKGAKFIVDHKVTDLEIQARARLVEISGKPRLVPPPTPPAPTPTPRVEPKRPSETPTTSPAPDDDLDRRMRTLFGTPEKR